MVSVNTSADIDRRRVSLETLKMLVILLVMENFAGIGNFLVRNQGRKKLLG